MNLNERAHELNRKLFDLCYELRVLSLAANGAIDRDADLDFSAAVCAVEAAQTQLAQTELVIDTARDEADQSYAVAADEDR